ncbi:MAG: M3 family oligoendopeptidase [Thermodesulfobacteriota bacterium]
MAEAIKKTATGAEGVKWNLDDLYSGIDDPQIEADLERSLGRAKSFEEHYRGKIDSPTVTPALLFEATAELEDIQETMGKVIAFAHLLFASDTADPKHGAFLQSSQERLTQIRKHILFFELELTAIPDDTAKKILEDEALKKYRHFLENERKYKPHRLSEPEEKIMDEKSNTGLRAFRRLFDEVINNIVFKVRIEGKTQKMTESEVLSLLYDPDRNKRKAAARGLTNGLKQNGRVLTYIFNTLVQDHATTDRLRQYPHPMASRNLDNEIDSETLEALLKATEAGYDLVHKYYRLKRKLLGVQKFYDYDRYSPVFPEKRTVPFEEGKEVILESFESFSPQFSNIASEFFDKNWIDAELREGKRGGAFSHGTVPSVHPYVFMNYTGRPRDVMTLAHELGHGIHQHLSRKQGYFQCYTPLTTAETASVFSEMVVFHKLKESEKDTKAKLALLCSKLEDIFATVSRQVVLTRFEQSLHEARKKEGELDTERINTLWVEANRPMFGDAIETTKDYALWWMYIPHFIHSPFYCYAYAFGELLVLALYNIYLREGNAFTKRYVELLYAGGSDTPERLLGRLGVNIKDPGFWRSGTELLREMVNEALELADGIAAQ